jgi:hypothetical protein
MDPIIAAKLIELGIVGIQGVFTLLSMAGKTPEEIDAIYAEEKVKFQANKPEKLPDV